ncbi:hypothetical protein OG689_05825 [Kitasatospora sp. NBC_00240]|uniref:hypothetical protein n=1 Tax=Kitasatospora sp. NBC_00240 TaxID=2903567 RepID=UPI0022588B18|nr:hypothetical protein [Kitasatospora sp. NBC_00240]MCX5208814.1 hypothetical protein [Kitasatospora sp. NBC_00240]
MTAPPYPSAAEGHPGRPGAPARALHLVTGARPGPATPVEERPLRALARVRSGPVPLDFDRLAARLPAVQSGLSLAGDADLELQLACTGPQELRGITAELLRAGAAQVRVELVLRTLTRTPATLVPADGPAVPVPAVPVPAAPVPAVVRSSTP